MSHSSQTWFTWLSWNLVSLRVDLVTTWSRGSHHMIFVWNTRRVMIYFVLLNFVDWKIVWKQWISDTKHWRRFSLTNHRPAAWALEDLKDELNSIKQQNSGAHRRGNMVRRAVQNVISEFEEFVDENTNADENDHDFASSSQGTRSGPDRARRNVNFCGMENCENVTGFHCVTLLSDLFQLSKIRFQS